MILLFFQILLDSFTPDRLQSQIRYIGLIAHIIIHSTFCTGRSSLRFLFQRGSNLISPILPKRKYEKRQLRKKSRGLLCTLQTGYLRKGGICLHSRISTQSIQTILKLRARDQAVLSSRAKTPDTSGRSAVPDMAMRSISNTKIRKQISGTHRPFISEVDTR